MTPKLKGKLVNGKIMIILPDGTMVRPEELQGHNVVDAAQEVKLKWETVQPTTESYLDQLRREARERTKQQLEE